MRFEIFHNLSVLHGDGCWNSADLFHVYLSVALCYELGCGVLDAVDVYGQYAHCAGWNGELGQFYSAGFELYAFFGGEVLQAFVVVDENECAMSLRAV